MSTENNQTQQNTGELIAAPKLVAISEEEFDQLTYAEENRQGAFGWSSDNMTYQKLIVSASTGSPVALAYICTDEVPHFYKFS